MTSTQQRPIEKMTMPVQTLSDDESQRLLEALLFPGNNKHLNRHRNRNYCMAVLMLDTGLRVGELVKLLAIDLYYADSPVGAITITCEKKEKKTQRTIPVTTRLHNAIITMRNFVWLDPQADPTRYAFFRIDPHHPLSTRQVQRIIRSAAFRGIGRSIHPHILRHTFATRLMTKCPIRVVQQLLGHAVVSSTQIYQHPNSQDLQNAINVLNEEPKTPILPPVDKPVKP